MTDLLEEKNDRLRGRRFITPRNLKDNSIRIRLAKRAGEVITQVTTAKTKKSIARIIKTKLINNYNFRCARRNCFVCARRR